EGEPGDELGHVEDPLLHQRRHHGDEHADGGHPVAAPRRHRRREPLDPVDEQRRGDEVGEGDDGFHGDYAIDVITLLRDYVTTSSRNHVPHVITSPGRSCWAWWPPPGGRAA